MRIRNLAVGPVLLVFCSWMALAQSHPGTIPDDVPNAERIQAYVSAFNAGDAAMSKFLKDNVAEAGLKQRSVEDRLSIYQQMHERLKSLLVLDVPDVQVSGSTQSVTALMQTGSGEKINLTFNFDPQAPNKLLSLRVEDAEDGPKASRPDAAADAMSESEFAKKVGGYLDDLAKKDEFSGVVLVARKGKPIVQKVYGLADKDKKIANNMDTKFNLGSMNKMFTRLCIGQLASQGKLSFDDKLGKFLPDYPNHEAAEKVTIKQLLNMRSGIGDFFNERYEATPKEKLKSLADYVPLFADKPLLFEPGTKQQYSNGGYVVLGLIIEKISGKSYYDYVKENVFRPAGMKDTDSYRTSEKVPNRAEGYTTEGTEGKGRRNNESTRPARGSSAGGGYSTAKDLLSFTKAIADGKLTSISPETGKPALAGMGIAGGAPGINGALEFDPKSGNTIIVLSNYDPPAAEKTAQQIRSWMKAMQD